MRPLYVSTVCPAAPRDLWRLLDEFERAGIGHVELGTCELEDDDDLVERLAGRPFDYLVHGNFPPPANGFFVNLASPDREVAERSLRSVLDSIAVAARLGSPLYSMHPGFVTDPVGYDQEVGLLFRAPPSPAATREADERFAEAARMALARARELGVQLLVENSDVTPDKVGRVLLGTAAELRALTDAVGGLGVLVDTGHLNVAASTYGFTPQAFLVELAPVIGGFHVHANDGTLDTHDPVAEGSWVLDALAAPELAPAAVTLEPRVPDVRALCAHAAWLERRLG